MKKIKVWEGVRLASFLVGIIVIFIGERYFSSELLHWWLNGTGLVLVASSFVLAAYCFRCSIKGNLSREVPSQRLSFFWQSLVVLSIVFYFAYGELMVERLLPESLLEKSLLASWLVFASLGLSMGIGVEWARFRNGEEHLAEPKRVQLAGLSWLRIGILSVALTCINYIAIKKNVAWDLSYLKTTEPSASTSQMIDSLNKKVDVVLFFPIGNEVLSRLRLYFEKVGKRNPELSLHFYDMETRPLQAEEFKVSRNGFVVVRSGDLIERIDLGTTLESARKGLKNLDAEFQNALIAVTQKKKVLYFTRGHGELGWVSDEKEFDGFRTIKKLESYLRNSGYTLRFFGVSDGAANSVPADADAIVIVGGLQPFLDQEVQVIKQYVESGGKLLVMFDVDVPTDTTLSSAVRNATSDPLINWLKSAGVNYRFEILANERNHVRASNSPVDVWFLVTNVFTSHASVQTLARNEERAAMITLKSGYFINQGDHPNWSVFDTVRSLSDTFVDTNRDFQFNESSEHREPRVIGVAMEQKLPKGAPNDSGRVVAFADATAASDALIENQANLVYIVDSLRWLLGGSSVQGVASTEEDVPIRHSKKEDVAWFYGTIGLVPILVLVAGRVATSRARRPRRQRRNRSERER